MGSLLGPPPRSTAGSGVPYAFSLPPSRSSSSTPQGEDEDEHGDNGEGCHCDQDPQGVGTSGKARCPVVSRWRNHHGRRWSRHGGDQEAGYLDRLADQLAVDSAESDLPVAGLRCGEPSHHSVVEGASDSLEQPDVEVSPCIGATGCSGHFPRPGSSLKREPTMNLKMDISRALGLGDRLIEGVRSEPIGVDAICQNDCVCIEIRLAGEHLCRLEDRVVERGFPAEHFDRLDKGDELVPVGCEIQRVERWWAKGDGAAT